jgi:hypothetical protein
MTTTRPITTATRVAVIAPGAVIALALGIAAVTLAPTLPSRVAIHFQADGSPDGWGSPWIMFAISLGAAALALVIAITSLRSRDHRTAATRVFVANLLAAAFATAWIGLASTAAVGDGTFPVWWSVVILAAGAAAGGVPAIELLRGAAPIPLHDAPSLAVSPTARVAWRAHAGSRWFAGIGVLLVALGIASSAWTATLNGGGAIASGVVMLVVGITVLALAKVNVTVDRRGLRLTSSWTRIPIMRVPLERIESCGWEQVSPGQWGGWGYRMSGRGIAYVTGSGPGLVVRLDNGQARMVTVKNADRGAAALSSLLGTSGTVE